MLSEFRHIGINIIYINEFHVKNKYILIQEPQFDVKKSIPNRGSQTGAPARVRNLNSSVFLALQNSIKKIRKGNPIR